MFPALPEDEGCVDARPASFFDAFIPRRRQQRLEMDMEICETCSTTLLTALEAARKIGVLRKEEFTKLEGGVKLQ